MINLKCRKCGGDNFAVKKNEKNPNATDLYCKDCGAWQKFATKDEIRLFSASDNAAPIKTAAEMFRKLGYVRDTNHNEQGTILYVKDLLSIVIDLDGHCTVAYEGTPIGIEPDELRAVCKLLDEMGVE